MFKREFKIIFYRLIGALALVGICRYLFDFSVLSPDIIIEVSAVFGLIELWYSKIDESETVFEELKFNDYRKFIEMNKVLKLRVQYFRFFWWLSSVSSCIVFILGLVLKSNPELIKDRDITHFVCFTILVFNVPVLITFIKAYFDSKDSIKEIKAQQIKDEMYLKNNNDNKNEIIDNLPSL